MNPSSGALTTDTGAGETRGPFTGQALRREEGWQESVKDKYVSENGLESSFIMRLNLPIGQGQPQAVSRCCILLMSGGAVTPKKPKEGPSLQQEHALAGGGGRDRDSAADAGRLPEHLIAVIACLMFCIWLHTPRQRQPPTQSLSGSLSLSPPLMHMCSHIHTNTHGHPPSVAHSAVHSQGKNSHRRSGMSLSRLSVALLPQLKATHLSLFP